MQRGTRKLKLSRHRLKWTVDVDVSTYCGPAGHLNNSLALTKSHKDAFFSFLYFFFFSDFFSFSIYAEGRSGGEGGGGPTLSTASC